MNSRWIGKEDAHDGHGQFEDGGPLIHFDSFTDYFYCIVTGKQIGRAHV